MANTTLNTQASQVERVKYFRIPYQLKNMLPNSVYTATVSGINIGPWCLPEGGNLGDPLLSDSTGQLKFTYHLSVPYRTTFVNSPDIDAGLMQNSKQLVLTDPVGRTSVAYIPITMKSN